MIAAKNYKFSNFLKRPLYYNPDIDILWVRGNPLFVIEYHGTNMRWLTLEVLSRKRRKLPLGPYLFQSVALDFAEIMAHDIVAFSRGYGSKYYRLAWYYAFSAMEVKKVYIVYSSGDRRDEVDQAVEHLMDTIKTIASSSVHNRSVIQKLKEKNERDGTSLTEWEIPSVEAILDTRLLNPIETFHNFSKLALELQRKIWEYAAIPNHRAI
ncbi:hypothetical protein SBOR_9837 [Sclerotinia borealis F-4128]|uniref:Uncharacterized protein n=1 Tax=Sclerotinia borealis (strain F-4128) TaxID=1432307 RepID=W9BYV3_SCLBF|nr:hypothetical protein SBOR_9837 [Sclerotinia borealis F-4128]